MKFFGWIIALCGLWEFGDIAAVFVPGFGEIPIFLWSHIITGVVLIAAGVWAARAGSRSTAITLYWVSALAGAWLIAAAFIFGAAVQPGGRWNDIIVGGIVLLLSAWAALKTARAAG